MTDRDSGSGFAVGLVLGAIAGLAVGFLYAPRPGKETRALLKEKAETVKEKTTEVAEEVKETAAQTKKKAQAKLDELKEREK